MPLDQVPTMTGPEGCALYTVLAISILPNQYTTVNAEGNLTRISKLKLTEYLSGIGRKSYRELEMHKGGQRNPSQLKPLCLSAAPRGPCSAAKGYATHQRRLTGRPRLAHVHTNTCPLKCRSY